MNKTDEKYLRMSIEIADQAYKEGNHPFGAILVDENGKELMRGGNSIEDDNDFVSHAETGLLRRAFREFEPEYLAKCTLYSSAEPCAMCSGAIYWVGVGRVVFGIGIEKQAELTTNPKDFAPVISCAEIISKGKKPIKVEGPFLEAEAAKIYAEEPK